MKEEWFRWERESTIHPLFIPYIGSFKEQRDYIGLNWPTTALIYNKNTVLWCNKIDSLPPVGQKLISKLLIKKNYDKLIKDFSYYTKRIKNLFKKIDRTNLRSLSNSDLLNLYKGFYQDYLGYWKIGMLAELVTLRGETLIKNMLKKIKDNKLFNQYLSVLISTTKKSFSREQEEDLLGILIKSKGNLSSRVAKDFLKKHSQKYFWLHNNYYSTECLGEKYFLKELTNMKRKYPDPKKSLLEIKKLDEEIIVNKKKIMKDLKLGLTDKKIIELIDNFGWFQDIRKKYNMIANHYLDLLLFEVGKRSKFSLMEMKYTLPSEIEPVLNGDFKKKEIRPRMKNCLFLWEGDKDNFELYVGKDAIKKEKEIFSSKKNVNQVTEIEGMAANQGRVRGYVHVTMSAKEAKNIKKGEILVTSMTSPDFIAGIKKSAAIVTNEGGVTCHAAIISREFGIPCVIGTKIATKVLKTGDYVEVDGLHGAVRILKNKT